MREVCDEIGIPPMIISSNAHNKSKRRAFMMQHTDINQLASELWPTRQQEEVSVPKKRRRWQQRKKIPYEQSMFWVDHHNPNCQNPGHRDGKEYRLNYRAPWSELNKLINRFKDNEWLSVRAVMPNGKRSCPLEIKILGTMYQIGTGYT